MPFNDIIGHTVQIDWLRNAIKFRRLAHAYIFAGEEAIGKRMTALHWIQAMNCEAHADASSADACGSCRACQQIMRNIHPDVLWIQPDESQSQHPQIKIERVREIEHHVIYRPLFADKKVCLIDQADRLTANAANALLKTLEDPPDHCLFILITSQPSSLLSTLKSRCFFVKFPTLSQDLVSQCLRQQREFSETDARFVSLLTNARLGEALTMDIKEAKAKQERYYAILFEHTDGSINHIFESAEALSKSGLLPEVFLWFWSGLRDLLLVATQSPTELVLHHNHLPRLHAVAQQTSLSQILNLLDELYELEKGLQRNLNMQLGLERFFLHLREAIPLPSH